MGTAEHGDTKNVKMSAFFYLCKFKDHLNMANFCPFSAQGRRSHLNMVTQKRENDAFFACFTKKKKRSMPTLKGLI